MTEIKDTVALSSQWMAAVRAIENQRPNGLFSDPIAAQLAGQEIIDKIAPSAQEYEDKGAPIVVIRTRFFDDFLMSVASSIRQVVILGAGMDTRAFRLSWFPNTHLYELEQPEVLKFKASRLGDIEAKCYRHPIEVDLREPWEDLLLAYGDRTIIRMGNRRNSNCCCCW
jgi:methyltransferase (TIGR00027 family)